MSFLMQPKKHVDTCTLLLDRAADAQRTRFVIARDENRISYKNPCNFLERERDVIKILSPLRIHGKSFFFCPEELVY